MSNAAKKKVMVLVEGEKRDVSVMEKLFVLYHELDAKYEIVSYRTNIYVLYQEFFSNQDKQGDLDLLQVLKAREADQEKKKLFDDKYTDILLIFDLDPQDSQFTEEKIRKMQEYFSESSDMGKLYLNYPMIESFFHMPTIPDPGFQKRTVSMEELRRGSYKERVHRESRGNDYRKFILNRDDSNYVIKENVNKALMLTKQDAFSNKWIEINLSDLLEHQLDLLSEGYLHVLSTCALYIYDYNSNLLLHN